MNGLGKLDRLNEMTDALHEQGIIKPGHRMPRTGARDIANECDELLRKRGYA